ncbi:GNAT family N-acetyltransferase [Rhizomonospora bruguierae]|uniref:GNAT family N-acetyltransferase n=1 Tax=Rhizomonospora bruguierae TaxID=1581705 RepID=UPI001BCED8C4|nr:GNAT family N-acetyltransferase [Micromonospora sp. NBRC 107566]
MSAPATLAAILARVEAGERLPTEPWLAVVPQPGPRAAAVVAFPGFIVVAADVDPVWVRDLVPDGDLSAALNPPFLTALCEKLGHRVNNIDMVLTASPVSPVSLPAVDVDHPRVRRARRYRDDITVYEVSGGVLILGRGLAGRWEAAIEVDEDARNAGVGRSLAAAARGLVPDGRPVWAQVAPDNAASVRAFLAAGYRPVGAEALLVP